MCGVIGLTCARDRKDLGAEASRLLRMLEYRGYDSTGALIQDSAGRVTLKKDVGAPSAVTVKLGIDRLSGKLFCGQVRWATFGAVTRANAQPHDVRCHTRLYGAHNGNITNCDQLKEWLVSAGHDVKSDNDGEMLVHTVEHYLALELGRLKDAGDRKARRGALKKAVIAAAGKITGSFAAVVADPVSELMACIKAGSSLYMGAGEDPAHGPFTIASSDLASVLSMTKLLYPIREEEFALYTPRKAEFFELRTGRPVKKEKLRSHLRVEETGLRKPFRYFMEQEIFGEPAAAARLLSYYADRSPLTDMVRQAQKRDAAFVKDLKARVLKLAAAADPAAFRKEAAAFFGCRAMKKALRYAGRCRLPLSSMTPESPLADLFSELRGLCGSGESVQALKFADTLFITGEIDQASARVAEFCGRLAECRRKGRAAYFVACGTSYNAARCGSVFFNRMAGAAVTACLPGDFRSQYLNAVRDGDVIIGISQSGETKDLIDLLNQVKATGRRVSFLNIVNNVNSTIALEKSDVYIPLYCGPEIAVPATKSFLSQLLALYILALRLGERLAAQGRSSVPASDLKRYAENLYLVPELIEETLNGARAALQEAAGDLYLEPSMHILATGMQGIAREGALKVREVVLNHTEGFESPEFKHGPNTILGVNTIFGMEGVGALTDKFADMVKYAAGRGRGLTPESLSRVFHAVSGYAFRDRKPSGLSPEEAELFSEVFEKHNFFESMYTNYPLVFVTGPNQRDVNLTISQINTHKIRGANVYVLAEEDAALREAARKSVPSMYSKTYRHGYIALPKTGDDLLVFFTSSAALQLLAMEMSVRKMEFLDRLGIRDHGVHPDSPKNVSKSITVD